MLIALIWILLNKQINNKLGDFMSSLYIAVEFNDEDKAKLAEKQLYLKQNSKKGDFEDPTKFHITVKFLSNNDIDNELAIKALQLFKERYKVNKFNITAKDFYQFDHNVSWIGVNNSLPLYEIKYQLDDCLKEVGFPLKKDKFKQYTPHITMGYNVIHNDDFNSKFDGINICIDNISLWNGFKANDKYIHNFIYRVDFE